MSAIGLSRSICCATNNRTSSSIKRDQTVPREQIESLFTSSIIRLIEMRQVRTASIFKKYIYKVSIVKPSCTLIGPDSRAQTAVFRIPERFFRCPCYKSNHGAPRRFPPMGGQVAGLNKAGLDELAPRGPAKVLADPGQGSLGGATQL